jgi:hypothetical protein
MQFKYQNFAGFRRLRPKAIPKAADSRPNLISDGGGEKPGFLKKPGFWMFRLFLPACLRVFCYFL